MADRAVELGRRIAVLATLPSALEPTADLVRARAAARGDAIELVPRLVEGAFAAIQAGDPERFDDLVRTAIRSLVHEVDVIVLAQASMGRVIDSLGAEATAIPVLVSTELGVARVIDHARATTPGETA